MHRFLVCLICLASVARATPDPKAAAATKIGEQKAKALIRGLKLAGVKAKLVDRTWTYGAKLLACNYTPDSPSQYADDGDGLGSAECDVDGKKYSGAAAAVLVTGMHDADLPEPYMMGDKKQVRAKDVTCIVEQTRRGADGPWSCTYTPVGRQ